MKDIILVLSALLFLAPAVSLCQWGEPEVYTVKEGKSYFTNGSIPFNLLGRTSKIDTVRGKFAFHDNSRYDFKGDPDQKDWNKMIGIQFWRGLKGLLNPNNNNIMIAWRYSVEGYWEVAPFVNRNKKWEIGRPIKVPSQRKFVLYELVRTKKGVWSVTLMCGNYFSSQSFSVNEKRKARLIDPWFGGEDNDSKGLPFGGKAPHEMHLSRSVVIIK